MRANHIPDGIDLENTVSARGRMYKVTPWTLSIAMYAVQCGNPLNHHGLTAACIAVYIGFGCR